MIPTERKPRRKLQTPIIRLIPNMMTIGAICAGLTALRFGVEGDFDRAVRLILLAAVLDGIDGRLARLLKCQSQIGAELDSLADFFNFGVAPAFIIYIWAFQDLRSFGWIAVLIYVICCVIRLARFNVDSKAEVKSSDPNFFVGVPSPAGAMLVMMPMFFSFLFVDAPVISPVLMSVYMVVVGLLMISRVPTYSFKMVAISRENVKFLIIGFVILVAALFTYLWATLLVLDLIYVIGIVWALQGAKRLSKNQE
ncbi:CDP-diacylglycerol--serine O-phosphatidyltransferase [Brevirhabdus pacifica]|uniref:CDP-diacylglycerol--serine O-phosphatidyltransferase n=1 Tax=Brevirhabdus pacifica TaxID=1267768 RepID=A0A1U7DES5_9RHOB|nr:CDP-diacylglycerol--serine O-phosphatidyltransferase [Brevirhabdus pacifica]APX88445.1 CDP-diacylglycerol--serine O-phosphatidyltransferase [Brevirhabdus pacifica]OWU79752.1 CDP-diacylglycerol--serine O-phosphatidyltransferase [Loktanella sp. 22II-4b]PJJ87090.1 CDP-diacylglycerol--serine O-phosphatidyltransferase [Brevirhabdus pacifica]